jgi:predicted MFS family arabinose efflux permease
MSTDTLPLEKKERWYSEVTGYQWLVLIVASAGWIFDIFENQLFVVTRGTMLSQLLGAPMNSPLVKYYSDSINSYFLVGGAVGGVLFGVIADRFGRTRSMILSILVYALFTALTATATQVWHVAVLRFFVAVGTGGEWAVAAALVSETFPRRARAHASGIFHASSVLGVAAAGLAGMATGTNWRYAYLIGLAPALLVLVVRIYIREPEKFEHARPAGKEGFAEFWTNRSYRRSAIFGLLLAAIGLAGYWTVFTAGQDLARSFLMQQGLDAAAADHRAKFAYSMIQNIGGGAGLFFMGPLCGWIGRRAAFVLMHLGVLVTVPLVCYLPATYMQLLVLLPLMAFFIVGMHAGYAVWFPELFPARIRATGAGLCFNGGRLIAALVLMFSAWLKSREGLDMRTGIMILSALYVPGILIALLLPETKGKTLEE